MSTIRKRMEVVHRYEESKILEYVAQAKRVFEDKPHLRSWEPEEHTNLLFLRWGAVDQSILVLALDGGEKVRAFGDELTPRYAWYEVRKKGTRQVVHIGSIHNHTTDALSAQFPDTDIVLCLGPESQSSSVL